MSGPFVRSSRAYALIPLLLVIAACGGPVYQQPQVTLDDVQLGGLGLSGGTLLVDLTVVNPNRFALRASELDYGLRIRSARQGVDTAWVDFASGVVDLGTIRRIRASAPAADADPEQGFLVPARDSARFQIPVEFTYAGLGSAGLAMLRYGSLTYQAEGTVHANTPIGSRRLPFRRTGTVTMGGERR